MNGITKQTRRQSYDGIRTRSGERCKLILETLGNRSMTVEEIPDELVAAGPLKYYDSRMGCGKEVTQPWAKAKENVPNARTTSAHTFAAMSPRIAKYTDRSTLISAKGTQTQPP